MIAFFLDHLWQSTLFAGTVALIALALHRHAARMRYWLWFAASAKFLVPFSLLVSVGSWLAPHAELPELSGALTALTSGVSAPLFTIAPLSASSVSAAARPDAVIVLFTVWLAGVGIAVTLWGIKWMRLRSVVKSARAIGSAAPVPVKVARTQIEPGLVGIWHPVILLPDGLASRLSPEELRSVIAHEICHLRRRDNLTAAIHTMVEAVLWFYPVTWWLGSRLLAERERACDESVIASGHDPKIYAEGILKVCRLYITSPLASAAGVSGSDLRKRIEVIMSSPSTRRMSVFTRLLIALAGIASVAAPLLYGFLSVAALSASAVVQTGAPTSAEIAHRLYEQTRPQKEVPFKPDEFDKYTGYYRFGDADVFFHVFRQGDRYLTQLTGQGPVEVFPESPSKFFATVVAAQISFETGPGGTVTGLVLHQNGYRQRAAKVSQATYEAAGAQLQRRINDKIPSPGTKASLLRWIRSVEDGRPNYDDTEPGLAAAARAQAPKIEAGFHQLGAFKSLSFVRVDPNGWNVYQGVFAHGRTEIHIAPLAPDGKVSGRHWRVLP
ncbi:MAG TPA: M56 family metallopeptidase [Steroidobacteraceae bacterium]|jgi:beta-lactamase regulating signal transducer with metallopeptidase domain